MECGQEMEFVSPRHIMKHGISVEVYRKKWPNAKFKNDEDRLDKRKRILEILKENCIVEKEIRCRLKQFNYKKYISSEDIYHLACKKYGSKNSGIKGPKAVGNMLRGVKYIESKLVLLTVHAPYRNLTIKHIRQYRLLKIEEE